MCCSTLSVSDMMVGDVGIIPFDCLLNLILCGTNDGALEVHRTVSHCVVVVLTIKHFQSVNVMDILQ